MHSPLCHGGMGDKINIKLYSITLSVALIVRIIVGFTEHLPARHLYSVI